MVIPSMDVHEAIHGPVTVVAPHDTVRGTVGLNHGGKTPPG
jgi:hypothetical protein